MRNKIISLIIVFFALITLLPSCAKSGKPDDMTTSEASDTANETGAEEKQDKTEEYLAIKAKNGEKLRLGAYMWYGYSQLIRGAYTDRLLDEFLDDYTPLELGYGYNEIEDMEYQIDLASDNGLSFFAIEYWPGSHTNQNVYENISLDYFLAAENSQKMDFCLLVANHDNSRIYYDSWKQNCEYFIKYMTKTNYLKLDGKPVLVFYLPDQLVTDLGGIKKTKECFDYLRSEMAKHGCPEILILGCDSPYGASSGRIDYDEKTFSEATFRARIRGYESCGFDAFTGFNSRPLRNKKGKLEIEYDELLSDHENCWEAFRKYTKSRYAPNLINGWDDRNKYPEISILSTYNVNKSAERMTEHIVNAYKWIKENPENSLGNLAFVYAWDEIDEGSSFLPTKADGDMMLRALSTAMKTISSME